MNLWEDPKASFTPLIISCSHSLSAHQQAPPLRPSHAASNSTGLGDAVGGAGFSGYGFGLVEVLLNHSTSLYSKLPRNVEVCTTKIDDDSLQNAKPTLRIQVDIIVLGLLLAMS